MKTFPKPLTALVLLAGMGLAPTAQASLIPKLGGTVVYDSVRNITWLQNANANGLMNWTAANAWAAGLNVGGFTGWRLPTALNADGSGPCSGLNQRVGAFVLHRRGFDARSEHYQFCCFVKFIY